MSSWPETGACAAGAVMGSPHMSAYKDGLSCSSVGSAQQYQGSLRCGIGVTPVTSSVGMTAVAGSPPAVRYALAATSHTSPNVSARGALTRMPSLTTLITSANSSSTAGSGC